MSELNTAPQPSSIVGSFLFAGSDGTGGLLAIPASVIASFIGATGGSQWRSGPVSPSNGLGVDNDFYINTTSSEYFKKTSGAYVSQGNLRGDTGNSGAQGIQGNPGVAGAQGIQGLAGADGATWKNGSGAPLSNLGVNNDYYLDTAAGDVYKKSSGLYSIVGNIKGDTGIQGIQGIQGPAGPTNPSENSGNQLTIGTDNLLYLTGVATLSQLNSGLNFSTDSSITSAQVSSSDFWSVWDVSAGLRQKITTAEAAIVMNQELTGDGIEILRSPDGKEFISTVVVNPRTQVKSFRRLQLDAFNSTADHRVLRKPKDRNYGPFAVKCLDILSDNASDFSSGVNNSTTTAPTVQAPTRFGSTYKTNAARFGGSVDIVEDAKAVFGTKRVKLVTGKRTLGGGSALGDPVQTADYTIIRRDDIGQTLNLTGKWIRIDLETLDPNAIDEIQFFLGDSNLTNFYRWNNLVGDQGTRPLQFGTKTRITFPLLVAPSGDPRLGTLGYNNSVTGTPNIANINSWQLRLLGKADASATISATVYIDRVASVSQEQPVLALCMDDGHNTWKLFADPILARYAARSTIFGIRGYHQSDVIKNPVYNPAIVGVAGEGFRLSEDQIAKMIEAGHELGFHMFGNHAGQDYSPQEVENEIIAFKAWSKEKFDYDVMTAAYPGGENGPFFGPNFPVGHGRLPRDGYTDYAGYNAGLASNSSWLNGQPKKLWNVWSSNNLKPDGTTYLDDSEVTIRDLFAKHFPISRSIVLNSPETDPPADGSMVRSFLYIFGPSIVPTSNGFGRAGLKSASPSYCNRLAIQKSTGTLAVGGTTSCTLAATDTAVSDAYVDHHIEIIGGAGYGQVRRITAYTTGRVATVNKPFIPAVDATTIYRVMIPRNMALVDAIRDSNGVGVSSFHDLFKSTKAEGSIIVGGTTSVTLDSNAVATLSAYLNNYIVITKGTGAGQIRKITAYSVARIATVAAFSPALDTTSQYEIFVIKQNGTMPTGGTTTCTLAASASIVVQEYLGAFIVTTGGTGAGQVRKITNYTTGRVATLDTPFSPATDATTTYDIFVGSQEVLLTNEAGNAAQIVSTNPYNLNALGTQSSLADLEHLLDYAYKQNISFMPLREALTRTA
jgi:peptidoglycan/xylan/chitin deacetylase (PgdA/CDA1 family)